MKREASFNYPFVRPSTPHFSPFKLSRMSSKLATSHMPLSLHSHLGAPFSSVITSPPSCVRTLRFDSDGAKLFQLGMDIPIMFCSLRVANSKGLRGGERSDKERGDEERSDEQKVVKYSTLQHGAAVASLHPSFLVLSPHLLPHDPTTGRSSNMLEPSLMALVGKYPFSVLYMRAEVIQLCFLPGFPM